MGAALWDEVRRAGLEAGLDRMGVCAAAPFPEVNRALRARRASGRSARLGFTFSRPDDATDVRRTFPWARRLVVGGRSYLPAAGSPGPEELGTGRIARFAVSDHYEPLRRALRAASGVLVQAGHRAALLVDDSRLVDRAAAVRAGVGWWGKNSMVLAPGVGPWMLLGSIVTDAPLPESVPMERSCGSCSACLPACPTGALVSPGVLDARLCLAAWAQAPGVIPVALRRAMGDRLYGCDDCLDVCPPGGRLLGVARRRRGRVPLRGVLVASDAELMGRFRRFYLPGGTPRALRRNALVALGNSGGVVDVPLLGVYLDGRDWLLRLHAAWAVGRIGGSAAGKVLAAAVSREGDDRVKAEMERALTEAQTPPLGR